MPNSQDAQPAAAPTLEPVSSRVRGADGLTLRMLEWSKEGVPLLLVHGFGNEAHIWDDFAPAVAPYYAVRALDWRGHGESDWHPEGAYDFEDHARDLAAVVDELGLERFVLCGHSLGGRASMLFALENADKLAGLIIVDTGPEHDPRGQIRIAMDAGQHPDPTFASIAEYEAMLAHQYAAALPSAIKRMAKHGLKQRDDGRFVLRMDPKFRDFGRKKLSADDLAAREKDMTAKLWRALEVVQCPTLVVRGAASDILSADVAERMADDVLAAGQLAVVARASHSVMTDNPGGFRKAVCAFVLGEDNVD